MNLKESLMQCIDFQRYVTVHKAIKQPFSNNENQNTNNVNVKICSIIYQCNQYQLVITKKIVYHRYTAAFGKVFKEHYKTKN